MTIQYVHFSNFHLYQHFGYKHLQVWMISQPLCFDFTDTPVSGAKHKLNIGSRSVSRQSRRDPLDHLSKRPETSEGRFSALEARASVEGRDTLSSPTSRPPTVASGKVVTISDVKDSQSSK